MKSIFTNIWFWVAMYFMILSLFLAFGRFMKQCDDDAKKSVQPDIYHKDMDEE